MWLAGCLFTVESAVKPGRTGLHSWLELCVDLLLLLISYLFPSVEILFSSGTLYLLPKSTEVIGGKLDIPEW